MLPAVLTQSLCKTNLKMKLKNLILVTLLVAFFSFPAGFFDFEQHKAFLEKQHKASLAIKDRQMRCLRQALWFEARGEPEEGVRAVATVIINRVQSKKYPDNFCRVIHQRMQFSYTHQFKSHEIRPKKVEYSTLALIDKVVMEVYTGDFVAALPPSVMWYHTTKVNPSWSNRKKQVALISNHRFFKER